MTASRADTLRRTPTEKAPEPDLGTASIPKERYTSPEFMRLELERLWPRVWLLAGRDLLLNSQERRIRHFHRILDHYLYGTPR